jgi:hypothetical protein
MAEAARAAGFVPTGSASRLELTRGPFSRTLSWPPVPAVRKSAIPGLVDGASTVRACPTLRLPPMGPAPWLPGCVKPDLGQEGEGFCPFVDAAGWEVARARAGADAVVQPLLAGTERRVTLCRDGTYAAARLLGREGRESRWADDTEAIGPEVLLPLDAILTHLQAPGAGFDLLEQADGHVLLDVNTNPALAIHLATERPRDLAPAFLAGWLDLP